ncbi:MAG: hypothetical protein ACI4JQ_01565 [Ruminococcus sp.]
MAAFIFSETGSKEAILFALLPCVQCHQLKDFFVANVPLERLQDVLCFIHGTRGSGLVRFPSKMLSHFFTPFPARQKDGAGSFAVCGRRQGALPLDPSSIFRENCCTEKAFIIVLPPPLWEGVDAFVFSVTFKGGGVDGPAVRWAVRWLTRFLFICIIRV